MNRKKDANIPGWEWSIAGLGALILMGAIVFFIIQSFTMPTEARLDVQTDSVIPSGSGYLLAIRVTNEGRTAADVVVEATLSGNATQTETSSVTIPYVPTRSTRPALLMFTRDPRAHAISLSVRGFLQP